VVGTGHATTSEQAVPAAAFGRPGLPQDHPHGGLL